MGCGTEDNRKEKAAINNQNEISQKSCDEFLLFSSSLLRLDYQEPEEILVSLKTTHSMYQKGILAHKSVPAITFQLSA